MGNDQQRSAIQDAFEAFTKIELFHVLKEFNKSKDFITKHIEKIEANLGNTTDENYRLFLEIVRFTTQIQLDFLEKYKRFQEKGEPIPNEFYNGKIKDISIRISRLINDQDEEYRRFGRFKSNSCTTSATIDVSFFKQSPEMVTSVVYETAFVSQYYCNIVQALISLKNKQQCPLEDFKRERDFVLWKELCLERYDENQMAGKSGDLQRYVVLKITRYWQRLVEFTKTEITKKIGLWAEQDMPSKKAPDTFSPGDSVSHMRSLVSYQNDLLNDVGSRYQLYSFISLVYLKYHLLMHRVTDNRFSHIYDDDYLKNEEDNEKILKHSIQVFTFLGIFARYHLKVLFPSNALHTNEYCFVFQAISSLKRGNTYQLNYENDKAFNDFTFTQRLVIRMRNKYGKLDEKDFPNDIYYLLIIYTRYLKGTLYYYDYSRTKACEYFCDSYQGFSQVDKDLSKDFQFFTKSSILFLKNMLFKGKSFLERGLFKRSLKWFLKSLEQSLTIMDTDQSGMGTDQSGRFNTIRNEIVSLVDYLQKELLTPVIYKEKISEKIGCIANRLNEHIDALSDWSPYIFSDILNRISMVLYLLNLPDEKGNGSKAAHRGHGTVALRFLELSHKINPQNALSVFDGFLYEVDRIQKRNLIPNGNASDAPEQQNWKETVAMLEKIPIETLNYEGEFYDRLYRYFSTALMKKILELELEEERCSNRQPRSELSSDKNNPTTKVLARRLLAKYLTFTDCFIVSDSEVYKYLMRPRIIGNDEQGQDQKQEQEIIFKVLQRWSSYTPSVPRPSIINHSGGGYFVIYNNIGIAIDPGFGFIKNLYAEGHSIADIDAIIITHDHVDHIAEFDTILSLKYNKSEINKEPYLLDLFLNQGFMERYSFLLKDNHYRLFTLSPGATIEPDKVPVPPNKNEEGEDGKEKGGVDKNKKKENARKYLMKIEVKQSRHKELSSDRYTVGAMLNYECDGKSFKIGITSDTAMCESLKDSYKKSDLLIVHINSVPYREFKYFCDLDMESESTYKNVSAKLTTTLKNLSKKKDTRHGPGSQYEERFRMIVNQFIYSLWYSKINNIDEIFKKDALDDPKDLQLGDHLFLHGILNVNDFLVAETKLTFPKQKLVVISEFREQMGSYRTKIASFINESNKENDQLKWMTGDCGMTIRCKLYNERESEQKMEDARTITVRCSLCAATNNALFQDSFFLPSRITETCIKSSGEGIFYFCPRHDPGKNEHFIEKIERYDLFNS